MPIIIPANSAVAGGFDIANGCRFDRASSDYLSRSFSGSRTGSGTKFTFSTWIKRSQLGTDQTICYNYGSSAQYGFLYFRGSQKDLRYFDRVDGGDTCVGTSAPFEFNDNTAWYHFVLEVDTTLGTGADRVKLYVNGVFRAFNFDNIPNQNQALNFGAVATRTISSNYGGGNYFDGYQCETIFIDGQALQADSFGEFDGDSGIWKPINVSGLTFGSIGFYLEYQNSGALGTDSSGGSNTFTAVNIAAVNQTTDTCTNNFATFNPLIYSPETLVFTEGNTNASSQPVGAQYHGSSTLGMTSGKWYAEFKCTAANQYGYVGISASPSNTAQNDRVPGYYADEYTLYSYNGKIKNNNTGTTYAAAYQSNNDIIGVAVDTDNNKIYFSKNGAWANGSGAWGSSTFNAGTGAYTITASNLTTEQAYFFIIGDADEGSAAKFNGNFGNPSYSTGTNQDGNDRGNFAYAVPSGHLALCTKNLSEVLS